MSRREVALRFVTFDVRSNFTSLIRPSMHNFPDDAAALRREFQFGYFFGIMGAAAASPPPSSAS
jgi:hypothetical protein